MSTLIPWGPRFVDPFAVAPALFRRPTPGRGTNWYAPTTDVVREGDDAVVRLELPGVDPGAAIGRSLCGADSVGRSSSGASSSRSSGTWPALLPIAIARFLRSEATGARVIGPPAASVSRVASLAFHSSASEGCSRPGRGSHSAASDTAGS